MIRWVGSKGTGGSVQYYIGGLALTTMVCSWGSGSGLVPPLAEEQKGTRGTVFSSSFLCFFFFLLNGGG